MSGIKGRWTLENRDNLDAFLACCGVSWFVRTMIVNLRGDVEFLDADNPGHIVKNTYSRLGSRTETLPYPGSFEPSRTLSGKPEVSEVFFDDDGAVIQEMKSKDSGELVARIERNVVGDKLHVTFKCGDIVANEIYGKVSS